MTTNGYVIPPPGWVDFGAHYDAHVCPVTGPLTFSQEKGRDGLPLWEFHLGCTLPESPESPERGSP